MRNLQPTTVHLVDPFQKSTKDEDVFTTAYESLMRSYIIQFCIGSFVLVIFLLVYRWRQRGRVGPKYWPLCGSIIAISQNYRHLHDWLLSFLKRMNTISIPMGCGQCHYYTVDPTNVKHLLETNSTNYRKGRIFHQNMEELLGEAKHHEDCSVKKWTASEFSRPALCDLSTTVLKKKTCTVARLISKTAYAGTSLDIQDLIQRVTLDTIGKVALGIDFASVPCDLQKPWPNIQFASALDSAAAIMTKRFFDPWWELKRYLNIGLESKLPAEIKVVDDFLYEVIANRKDEIRLFHGRVYDLADDYRPHAEAPCSSDLLSTLLKLLKKIEHEHSREADELLRHMVTSFITASRDSTGVTLTWFVYQMTQNEKVAHKVYEELRTYHVVRSRRPEYESSLSNEWDDMELEELSVEENYLNITDRRIRDFASLLTSDSLDELPYLHACVQETLRLHPVVPLDPWELEQADTLPDGVPVGSKSGNMVFIAPYSMARMSSIWGPNASEFNPERWLQNGKFSPQLEYKFVTFQAGLYTGAVRPLTYQNCKFGAAILGRFFEFIYAGPSNRRPRYSMTATLLIEGGLPIYARLRD